MTLHTSASPTCWTYPWVQGYGRLAVRGSWKYLDIDLASAAPAAGARLRLRSRSAVDAEHRFPQLEQPVAQLGRPLELEVLGGVLHLLLEELEFLPPGPSRPSTLSCARVCAAFSSFLPASAS